MTDNQTVISLETIKKEFSTFIAGLIMEIAILKDKLDIAETKLKEFENIKHELEEIKRKM